MPFSRFSKQVNVKAGGNTVSNSITTALAGLDMVTPMESLKDGKTPDSKNFRLYEQSEGGREASVTTRKGPGVYIDPLGETIKQSLVDTSGTQKDVLSNAIFAKKITTTFSGIITRLDLHLAASTGSGPIRVDIYSDVAGKLGSLLTQSSFTSFNTVAGWSPARFIKALEVSSGTDLWIVAYLQDDGSGAYKLSTTTGTSLYSISSILGLQAAAYDIPYRLYGTNKVQDKNVYRFNRESGENVTVVPFGTTLYMIDEVNKVYKPVVTGLNASAIEYSFTNADGRVFWTDQATLMTWNGIHEDTMTNIVGNGSFTTNTTGWTAYNASTIARNTTTFNSTPASLYASKANVGVGVDYLQTLTKNHRYKITFKARADVTATVIRLETLPSVGGAMQALALTGTFSAANTWQTFTGYFTPTAISTALRFYNATSNFYLDDVEIIDTNIETITDPELGSLKEIVFHKDRLMGVSNTDPNKIVFSENPGNPSDLPGDQQWYHQWLSVSFIYSPRPMNGSPVTGLFSFQDALTVLTQDKKYIISGSDRGDYYQRESTGSKGALARRGIVSDPNYIYFVADDGIYRFNGSKDEKISGPVKPLFDKCPRKNEITLSLWKSQLRVYLASELSSVNDTCLIFDIELNEWMYDTDTFVNRALYYADADDDMQLVEFSSLSGAAYFAEQGFNSVGAPIDFEYKLKYNSYGTPAQRKKIKRFYPLLQSVGSTFLVTHGIDKDLEDSPRKKQELLQTGGRKLGTFTFTDGVTLSGKIAYKPKRLSVSGYARTFQYRVSRNAVNNQVAFSGVQLTFKEKRL